MRAAEAELREPEAGIREFWAGLGDNAVRWAVGGTCDAANRVTSPWAGLLEVGAGFVTQKGQF